ncbi:hypothetical protein AB3M75_16770 [Serratia ureilytica]|uniref:hypothetical protein n=1 Tax=Serratia ureilytica TaxID=300181 RepID=UPI00371B076D
MTNLSELSKPVAWKLHHHDRYYFEENADVVAIAESMAQAKGDPVYSQEYVSALLAELEDERASREQLQRNCTRTEERIAELEAKLATPVRLPNKNDAEFWFGSTFQVAKFDRAVERAVSAAGFKFVGDE